MICCLCSSVRACLALAVDIRQDQRAGSSGLGLVYCLVAFVLPFHARTAGPTASNPSKADEWVSQHPQSRLCLGRTECLQQKPSSMQAAATKR